MNFKSDKLPEKQWFETRIVLAKRYIDKVDDDVWDTILLALKNKLVLHFDYETVTENRDYSEKGRRIFGHFHEQPMACNFQRIFLLWRRHYSLEPQILVDDMEEKNPRNDGISVNF